MKKLIELGGALLFAVTFTSATAASDKSTFHAFSKLSMGDRATLAAMADGELAAVEGGDDIFTEAAITAMQVIVQNHENNTAVINQQGNGDNTAAVSQTGHNNTAVVTQGNAQFGLH